jgi:cyclohexanone monooxygenase
MTLRTLERQHRSPQQQPRPTSRLPARNAPLDPDKESAHKAQYPERRRAAFDTPFGIAGYPAPVKSALDATKEERLRAYEAKWAEGRQYLASCIHLMIC